jgi:hypothetical protein
MVVMLVMVVMVVMLVMGMSWGILANTPDVVVLPILGLPHCRKVGCR